MTEIPEVRAICTAVCSSTPTGPASAAAGPAGLATDAEIQTAQTWANDLLTLISMRELLKNITGDQATVETLVNYLFQLYDPNRQGNSHQLGYNIYETVINRLFPEWGSMNKVVATIAALVRMLGNNTLKKLIRTSNAVNGSPTVAQIKTIFISMPTKGANETDEAYRSRVQEWLNTVIADPLTSTSVEQIVDGITVEDIDGLLSDSSLNANDRSILQDLKILFQMRDKIKTAVGAAEIPQTFMSLLISLSGNQPEGAPEIPGTYDIYSEIFNQDRNVSMTSRIQQTIVRSLEEISPPALQAKVWEILGYTPDAPNFNKTEWAWNTLSADKVNELIAFLSGTSVAGGSGGTAGVGGSGGGSQAGVTQPCCEALLGEAQAVHQGATEEGAHWLNVMDSWLKKHMFGLNLQLSLGGLFGGESRVGAPDNSFALGLDVEAPFDIAQGQPYGLRVGPFLHLDYLTDNNNYAIETGAAMEGGYHDHFDANYLLKLYYKGLMNETPTLGYPNMNALGLSLAGTLGGAWSNDNSYGIGSVMIAYDLLYGELNGRTYMQNILRFAPLHLAVNDDALLSLGAAFRDDQYSGLMGAGLENMGVGIFGKLHLDVGGDVDLLFSGEGWFMENYPNEWNVAANILFPVHRPFDMGIGVTAGQRNTFLPGPTNYGPETYVTANVDFLHIPLAGMPTADGLDLYLDIGGQVGATDYPGQGWEPTGGLTATFSLGREHEELDEEEFPGAGNAAMMAADDIDDLDEAAYNHDFYQQKLIDAFKIGGLTAGYEYDPAVLSARLTAIHDYLISHSTVYDGDQDGEFDMDDALLYYSTYEVGIIQDPEVTLGNVGYVRDNEILQAIDARRWLIEQGTAVDQQSTVTNLATALLSAIEVLVAHSNPQDYTQTDGTATNLADAHWDNEIKNYFNGTKEEFINCLKQELAGRVIGKAVAAVISYLRGEAVTTFTAGDAQLVLNKVAEMSGQCEHLAAPPSPSI